jgi:hypothetical protein
MFQIFDEDFEVSVNIAVGIVAKRPHALLLGRGMLQSFGSVENLGWLAAKQHHEGGNRSCDGISHERKAKAVWIAE